MKDFYCIHEGCAQGWSTEEYLQNKRDVVLNTIKPICEAFEITDYDYTIENGRERLIVEGTEIACSLNSIGATVNELINYIWMNTVYETRFLEGDEEHIHDVLTKYWVEK